MRHSKIYWCLNQFCSKMYFVKSNKFLVFRILYFLSYNVASLIKFHKTLIVPLGSHRFQFSNIDVFIHQICWIILCESDLTRFHEVMKYQRECPSSNVQSTSFALYGLETVGVLMTCYPVVYSSLYRQSWSIPLFQHLLFREPVGLQPSLRYSFNSVHCSLLDIPTVPRSIHRTEGSEFRGHMQ